MKKLFKFSLLLVSCFALVACSGGSESFFLGNSHVERGSVTAQTDEGDITLSYLTSGGAGRRVIFVHGTPGQAVDYYRLIRNAPVDVEYIAVDRPGYGETTPYKLYASLEVQADALAPLLVEKNGKKPIVVGHSSGGPIAAMLAIRHGDKMGGLILASASLDPALEPDPVFVQQLGNAPVISWFVPKDLQIINRELLSLPDQLSAMTPKLADIEVPTIVMHGTADVLVPFGNVAYMEQHLTGTPYRETVAVQGLGHEIPWQRSVLLSKGIRKLVDEQYETPTPEIEIDRRHWVLRSQIRRELRDPASLQEK